MKTQKIMAGLVLTLTLAASASAQEDKKAGAAFLAPPNQVIAIKTGKLYEPNSGTFLNNQVIIIHGDRNGVPLSVGIGAIMALWTVTVLAAYCGAKISAVPRPKLLNKASGILFAVIGLYIIATAI